MIRSRVRRPRVKTPINDHYGRIKDDLVAAARPVTMRGTVTGQGSTNKVIWLAPTGEGVTNQHDYAVVEPALHTQVIGTPTAAVGAGAGSGAPAPVIVSGSLDTRGAVTFGSGASPNGAMCVVTYGTQFRVTPFPVIIPTTQGGAVNGFYISAYSTTGFTISSLQSPPASQGNTYFGFIWHAYSSPMGFVLGDSAHVEQTRGGSWVTTGKIN